MTVTNQIRESVISITVNVCAQYNIDVIKIVQHNIFLLTLLFLREMTPVIHDHEINKVQ
jgi:hypothetical protein